MSEERKNFSKCGEGKKNVSVELRVFGKKRKLEERKIPKKKSKFFLVKKNAKFVFTGWVFLVERKCYGQIEKLKLRLLRKKNQGFLFTGIVPTGWASCYETWLKEKNEI